MSQGEWTREQHDAECGNSGCPGYEFHKEARQTWKALGELATGQMTWLQAHGQQPEPDCSGCSGVMVLDTCPVHGPQLGMVQVGWVDDHDWLHPLTASGAEPSWRPVWAAAKPANTPQAAS